MKAAGVLILAMLAVFVPLLGIFVAWEYVRGKQEESRWL